MALNQIGPGGVEGCKVPGQHKNIIQSVGATRTLLPAESGSLCLLDAATGVVYTLPTPVAGMQFEFLATVAVTSNSYKVITGTIASQFLLGAVMAGNLTVAASGDIFQGNGTTHVAITQNGTDTGGLIGSYFKVTAISTTQWVIEGVVVGSGTNADPFATS